MKYKKSKYIIDFYNKASDSYLFFNCVNQSLIEIKPKYYKQFKKLLESGDEFIPNNNLISYLIAEKFLIPLETDEVEILQTDYLKYKSTAPVVITIAPTLACNFSCHYCYQKKNGEVMNLEVANSIVNYINSIKDRPLHIKWIGGEPLLNYDILLYISRKINTPFTSTLYTNGYHLNKIVNKLISLNITRLYITLDGPPERHNSLRFTKTDKKTFFTIFENIKQVIALNESIEIIIKTNLSDNCKEEFQSYINKFAGLEGKVKLTFGAIIKDINRKNTRDGEFLNFESLYYEELLTRGFASYKLPLRKMTGCDAYVNNSIAIDPKGRIHKCIEGIGTNNLIIGNVIEGKISLSSQVLEEINEFDIFNNKTCTNCVVFPICMGGCMRGQLKVKDQKKVVCKLDKYSSTVEMISKYFNNKYVRGCDNV